MDSPQDKTLELEKRLSELPQVDCPLSHYFAPGVYLREIYMPAGVFVIGKKHKTEHFNIVLKGRARVMIEGRVKLIEAPCTFISQPGVRKVLHVLDDMIWQTVHPTEETDIETLESLLVEPSVETLTQEERRVLIG